MVSDLSKALLKSSNSLLQRFRRMQSPKIHLASCELNSVSDRSVKTQYLYAYANDHGPSIRDDSGIGIIFHYSVSLGLTFSFPLS